MKNILKWLVISSVLASVSGLVNGCTLIGHLVGKGIDGPIFEDVNSVAAIREIDSSGEAPLTRLRFDSASLAPILKMANDDDLMLRATAGPDAGFADSIWKTQVEIITRYVDGSFSGGPLILDTLLAAELPSTSLRRYALLPGEQITLLFKEKSSTRIQGTVVRFGEKLVVLNTGSEKRGFPMSLVDTIFVGNGTPSTALPHEYLRGHIVSVPCLLLVDVPSLIIPLEDVEQISIRAADSWGPWCTRLTIAGGAVDLVVTVVVSHLLAGGVGMGELSQ